MKKKKLYRFNLFLDFYESHATTYPVCIYFLRSSELIEVIRIGR